MAFGCQPELSRKQIQEQFDIFEQRIKPKVLLTERSLRNPDLMVFRMHDETWKENPVYKILEKEGVLQMTLKDGSTSTYSARIEMSPAISVQTLALCGVQDYTLRPGFVEGAEAKLWDMGLNLATNLKVTFQITYNINRLEGLIALRKSMYHEFIEAALVYMNIVALGDPKYIQGKDVPNFTPGDAFTHDVTEQAIELQLKDSDFYKWGGKEPTSDAFESQSRSHEKEAERLASNASSLDKGGSHLQANSKWKECAEAWERAARAWDASTHPDARSKAKDARKEMRVAAKKAGHWEVNPSSGKEITIKYRDWFGDFEAEILDTTGRRIDKFTRSIEQGEICWGAEGRIKAGTYFVKVKLLGDEFEKEKIAILG